MPCCGDVFTAIHDSHVQCLKEIKSIDFKKTNPETGLNLFWTCLMVVNKKETAKSLECLDLILAMLPKECIEELFDKKLTPLVFAVQAGKASLVSLLLKNGASVLGEVIVEVTNRPKRVLNPFVLALHGGNLKVLAAFFAHDKKLINYDLFKFGFGIPGYRLIHLFSENHNSEFLNLLIEQKAQLDAVDSENNNAIHYAVKNSSAKTGNFLKKLIGLKINLNAVNKAGQTPLEIAVKAKNISAVQVLLNHNAEISSNVINAAEVCGDKSIAKLIKSKLPVPEVKDPSESPSETSSVRSVTSNSDNSSPGLSKQSDSPVSEAGTPLPEENTRSQFQSIAMRELKEMLDETKAYGPAKPWEQKQQGLKIIPVAEHKIDRSKIPEGLQGVLGALYVGFPCETFLPEMRKTVAITGGFIPHVILGFKPNDYDLVVNLSLKDIVYILKSAFRDTIQCEVITPKGKAPAFVQVNFQGLNIQISPIVDYKSDYLLRDFHINGMFLEWPTLDLHDYGDGLKHTRHKFLQTIISSLESFEVDPGRMLRAIYCAAKLGIEVWHESIEHAMTKHAFLLENINADRLIHEIATLINNGPAVFATAMKLLKANNLDGHVIAGISKKYAHNENVKPLIAILNDWDIAASEQFQTNLCKMLSRIIEVYKQSFPKITMPAEEVMYFPSPIGMRFCSDSLETVTSIQNQNLEVTSFVGLHSFQPNLPEYKKI